jgi:ubiquinone/menaquinone biosynthesis C-methylase UbiE
MTMRRSLDLELMDLPGQPPAVLEEDLRNLRTMNRYLGGQRAVLGAFNRLITKYNLHRVTVLDVGTGSGDIAAAIAGWARRRRIHARITAADPDPVTIRVAATHTREFSEIAAVRADGALPPFRPGSFDFVLASQLLHHFDEKAIVGALKTWSRLARRGIIVSDLLRDPLAYHGIRLLTKMFTNNVMTLTDAPLSVHRAFTMAEWRDLIRHAELGPAQIFPVFPFRVVALIPVSG